MNLQLIMLEDDLYTYCHWVQNKKKTRVYTLGILSIFPLFFAMYEDSYKTNPNIWEKNNQKSVYAKDFNIRPFHGE